MMIVEREELPCALLSRYSRPKGDTDLLALEILKRLKSATLCHSSYQDAESLDDLHRTFLPFSAHQTPTNSPGVAHFMPFAASTIDKSRRWSAASSGLCHVMYQTTQTNNARFASRQSCALVHTRVHPKVVNDHRFHTRTRSGGVTFTNSDQGNP